MTTLIIAEYKYAICAYPDGPRVERRVEVFVGTDVANFSPQLHSYTEVVGIFSSLLQQTKYFVFEVEGNVKNTHFNNLQFFATATSTGNFTLLPRKSTGLSISVMSRC